MLQKKIFNELTIRSFNCKNNKTSVNEIQGLCKDCDIILLQETWLCDQEISFMNSIHKDFYSRGI